MKNQIFIDDIVTENDEAKMNLAVEALQKSLPEGSYIHCCAHRMNGVLRAKLHVFIGGDVHHLSWSGKRVLEFVDFITNHLVPILKQWKRGLTEFFRNLQLSGDSICDHSVCEKLNCPFVSGKLEDHG